MPTNLSAPCAPRLPDEIMGAVSTSPTSPTGLRPCAHGAPSRISLWRLFAYLVCVNLATTLFALGDCALRGARAANDTGARP